MKQEDIDWIKSICEEKGLHFDFDQVDGSALIVREKKYSAKYIGWEHSNHYDRFRISFDIKQKGFEFKSELGEYLAKCIQDYLNK